MPHPPGRKALTRARILRAARWLFRTRGYQATSIDAVMMACGLTHGGFYLHFHSKAALYREAMAGFESRLTAISPKASAAEPKRVTAKGRRTPAKRGD